METEGPKKKVWFAFPPERCGAANYLCYNRQLVACGQAYVDGHTQMIIDYTRTDHARNTLVDMFLEQSRNDDDTLVMLDTDHQYPRDAVSRLARWGHEFGVVGALAFRRGEPYDPLFFVRRGNEGLHAMAADSIAYGELHQCAVVSTSMIAIKRWVFLELEAAGYAKPWFRYEYPTTGARPSEDMYFARICESAGIWHYCDTSVEIPHSTIGFVNHEVAVEFARQHPELIEKA